MTETRCCPECGHTDDLHELLPPASGFHGWPAFYSGAQPSSPDPIHPIFSRVDRWSCTNCGWEGTGQQLQHKPTTQQELRWCWRDQARRKTNEGGGGDATGKSKPVPPAEHRPEQEAPPSIRDRSTSTRMVEHRTARLAIYLLPHRRKFLASETDVRHMTVTQLVELALAEWFEAPTEVPKASGEVRLDIVITPSNRAFLGRQSTRRGCSVNSLVNCALTAWVLKHCPDVAGLW